MWNDVNMMLKRAEDCQRLAAPADALSTIVQNVAATIELDESVLDQVAAAIQFQRSPADRNEQKQ